MRNHRLQTVCILALAIVVSPAAAQHEDEEDDWEKRDRLYLERIQEKQNPENRRLTLEEREEFRQRFLENAAGLIKDRNYRFAAGERYKVMTDDPRLRPQQAVELLESFHEFFESFWDGRLQLAEYNEVSPVFLFYSFYKFNKIVSGEERFGDFRPSGHYRSYLDMITLHSDGMPPQDLPGTLLHEAAHQLVAMRLNGGRSFNAPWLSEGLASYFEFTYRNADGAWLAGEVGGMHLFMVRGAPRKRSGTVRKRIRDFNRKVKKQEGWSLDDITGITSRQQFYGTGVLDRYIVSWLLVHFLLHGEGGKYSPALFEYMKLDLQGRSGPDVLYDLLELTPMELQEKLVEYAENLKPR